MRAVDPATPRTATRNAITQRMLLLRPRPSDLVDAAFLVGLILVAFLGFGNTFASSQFLAVGLIAALLGIVTAHLTAALNWHWLISFAGTIVIYFVFGGAVAFRADVVAGCIPSGRTILNLASVAIHGWKALLTTLPPVAGDSQYLSLVWLLGLFTGVAGYGVAHARQSPRLALLMPNGLAVLVIPLGGLQPSSLPLEGLGIAALSVGWVVTRTFRRRRLTGTGAPRLSQIISGVVMAGLALGLAATAGPVLPGTNPTRTVLRTYMQPPLDVSQYPSPLPGFSKYVSVDRQLLCDVELLTVTGAPSGSRIRFAVLDQYTGVGWSASGTSAFGAGFQRVGTTIPIRGAGAPVDIGITVSVDYSSLVELRNWVPSLGASSQITFQGDNARSHTDSLAYDIDKGQALITDGFQGGDSASITTFPIPELTADEESTGLEPAGTVMVPNSASDFISDQLNILAGDSGRAWQRLMNVGRSFTQGYWSDGSKTGEGFYTPGDGQGRLLLFLSGEQLIGSDEQYAAAFALAANRLGYPARVVFGADIEADNTVMGKDVVIWVEINTVDGWTAVPTSLYIPPRDRQPDQVPPDRTTDNQAAPVPPPNPAEPPGNLDDLSTQANAGHGQGGPKSDGWLSTWLMPMVYAGSAILGVALVLALFGGAKLVRSRRRRRRADAVARIAGGWQDLLDRVRDMGGHVVTGPLTHKEQAAAIGLTPLTSLVPLTDALMFGPTMPTQEAATTYWLAVDQAKTSLLADRGHLRRLLARVNPRSLLPLTPASASIQLHPSPKRPPTPPTSKRPARRGIAKTTNQTVPELSTSLPPQRLMQPATLDDIEPFDPSGTIVRGPDFLPPPMSERLGPT